MTLRPNSFSVFPVDKERHQDERDADAAGVVLVVRDPLRVGVVGVFRDGWGVDQDVGDEEDGGRRPVG